MTKDKNDNIWFGTECSLAL
ncbi:MAG: hypothetical protein IPN72_24650 [Saprospiraceae bacterium]|nr:hypothetical protein [Saprospiraceae bacterium]